MLSDSSAENYFSNHLLAAKLATFSAAERQNAVRIANTDICSVLGRMVEDSDPAELIAALCEQAIYLLLNRDTLYEAPDRELASEKIDGLGSRSYRKSTAPRTGNISGRAKELITPFITGTMNLKRG